MGDKKKLLLEDLLDRARQSENDKIKFREYYSEILGGTIQVNKMPLRKITELMDNVSNSDSISESFDGNVELIYMSVPIFQNKELQATYGCVEPYDIVAKIFDDNINEINNLAEFILSFYGLSNVKDNNDVEPEDMVEELKN